MTDTLKVAGMAVLPERLEYALKAMHSLIDQVDRLYVVLNDSLGKPFVPILPGYEDKLHWKVADNRRGDAEKFSGLDALREEGVEDFFYFSCDDDLIYPATYAEDMIGHWRHLGSDCIVSLHGSMLQPDDLPLKTYYGQRSGIGCLQEWHRYTPVTFPGTGVMMYHSRDFDLSMRDFPTRNMADIHVGLKALRDKVPVVAVPHLGRDRYLRYDASLKTSETIWGKHHRDDAVQTRLINEALCPDRK